MGVRRYDPAQNSLIMGGQIMEGFAEGTFINITRNADSFSLVIGADGSGTRTKSNDRSGKIAITLQQTSPSNDVLQGFLTADELNNGGQFTALHKDNSGRTVNAAETAWVMKPPDQGFAKEAENREWVIETDNLEVFVGGNPV